MRESLAILSTLSKNWKKFYDSILDVSIPVKAITHVVELQLAFKKADEYLERLGL